MTAITAKVECTRKVEAHTGTVDLAFSPDYHDGRNAEWAKYTPSLSLTMNVLDVVGEHFDVGGKYTLTFQRTDETPQHTEHAAKPED